jgi:hypothetical protein
MNQAWELASRKLPFLYHCSRCGELLHHFTEEALATLPGDLSAQKQSIRTAQLVGEVDDRVRAHVRRTGL